jgi:hypothetical protein
MCLVPSLKFKKMGTIGICPPKNGAARFDSCRPCPSCHRITLAHLHANVASSPVSEICLLPRAIRCKKGCTCVGKKMSFAISTSSSVTYLTLQARVPMAIPMLTCHQMVARTHAHARADPCGSGRDAKTAVTGLLHRSFQQLRLQSQSFLQHRNGSLPSSGLFCELGLKALQELRGEPVPVCRCVLVCLCARDG